MGLFALACMLLKFKRPRLPRAARISWTGVLTAFACILAFFVGNVLMRAAVLSYFVLYFSAVALLVDGVHGAA